MSIYRGAGGSGDAVNDSSSEATLVAQLVVEAQADADAAQASATAAAGSASTASTQATNASNSATAASTSASNASTSATNAASSASAASTSASNASTSATNASNSATSASTSASTATTQAGIATTQASNASTSATNASNSATAAAGSASTASSAADAALAALDSFDDRYLGQKSTAPTVDNDGNALITGALYFNTTTNEMKVWDGSQWLNAYASLSGALLTANNLSDLNNTATARTNLGVAIGTNVQAYDADLTTLGAGGSSARSFLGLAIGTDVQAYDAQLADIAGLTPSDNNFIVGNGTNFVAESGSTARTSLGLGSIATQDANNVAVTGGSINNTPIGASTASTGAFTTATASTSLTTPIVQATNSAGLALKNSAGTTQMSMGAGGGDNMAINVSTNLNGTNAQIDISPTGTGHVHIKPTGVNSVEIAPTYVGTINNMSIGATTASTGSFSTLSASGVATFSAGTNSAPSITTTGDTNTGIFFPTADAVGFAVGGADAARLTNGTLSVSATSSSGTTLRLYEDTDNGTNHIDITAPSVITSDRTLTLPDLTGTLSLANYSIQVFTSSGTYTKPAGVAAVKVTVVGGGGGGGSAAANIGGFNSAATGGGGAGTSIKLISASLIGSTETITIGALGSGGSSGGNGASGGTSSFGSHCSATGGGAGLGCPSISNTGQNTEGGSTSTGGAGSGGNVDLTGGSGGFGFSFATPNRGVGGSGGASFLCAGPEGVQSSSISAAATQYGAGGSGGASLGGQGAVSGGNGAAGIIIVEEFY